MISALPIRIRNHIMPKNDSFTDDLQYSQAIVTKVLPAKGPHRPRLRGYLNTPRTNKRGQMNTITLRIDDYPDADCIEQVHALAAYMLADSLGWSDRNLIPIKCNRLAKKNDTGEELIWIKPEGAVLKDFLEYKEHWYTVEDPMAYAQDEDWVVDMTMTENPDEKANGFGYKNDICDMKVT